ncbi:MAG TPA: hypothetical protein DCO75_06350 [Fibrobacteres bacterium]|jgi:hypothetical protein|nr:hypothetical protein [Fibrobacterota bacterium]
MTSPEFITAIESWYEQKYKVVEERKLLMIFLDRIVDLENFFLSVTTHHSKKWKSLPDIVVMREIQQEKSNPEILAEIWWLKLINKSGSSDVLITDPIAHFVVSGFGSWDRFCEQRDGDYRELTHKDFISRYVSAFQSDIDVIPRVLPGYYGVEYGIRQDRIAIIGDVARGRALLAAEYSLQIENLTSFIKQVPEAE